MSDETKCLSCGAIFQTKMRQGSSKNTIWCDTCWESKDPKELKRIYNKDYWNHGRTYYQSKSFQSKKTDKHCRVLGCMQLGLLEGWCYFHHDQRHHYLGDDEE